MLLVTMPLSQRVASAPVMRRKARVVRGKIAAEVRMAASSWSIDVDVVIVTLPSPHVLLVQSLESKQVE